MFGPRVPGSVLGLSLLVPLMAGCPDSEAKFNEFLDNTKDDRDFMPPPPPDVMPAQADISGDFLLAVSTVIARDLPLQFIATNTLTTDEMGNTFLAACLQPLSLTAGKVNVPREPIGDPLCYEDIPIVDGKFDIDAGVVKVTGMANPVTGGDIEATLRMIATIIDEDFFCGEIEGDLMSPLMSTLKGSTFAAVRLEDPAMLPLDVTKSCSGDTVRDKE
ncbi:hypothetical protein OV090_29785 [Nannocystis sp. RBIL2]|uniref:hypothetical protein n=1 Tax=Nannocystis sp. RBIL2 TaxID=2996788 RepID=UPI00226EACEC|nr:hypothetical protein [Nannocystis sp. RBIL2]MCY1068967.1 hypothetical protein [Nannocystis sp. RBIL2]